MAIILDGCNRKHNINPLPDSLIHSYNKKCFENINEAAIQLLNKTLLPGEFAVAYYNDPNAVYGESAIFAIGPLSHGRGNILFKNSEQLDSEKLEVEQTLADQNNTITNFQENINIIISSLQSTIIKQQEIIESLIARVEALENKI